MHNAKSSRAMDLNQPREYLSYLVQDSQAFVMDKSLHCKQTTGSGARESSSEPVNAWGNASLASCL